MVSPPSPRLAGDALLGRVLGDFVIKDKIGEGGFGLVFRAEQRTLGRLAVIKILHDSHRSQSAFTQRFLREARTASQLDHPYAAHVYAFGAEPDGLLWIAMELVRGTPLDRLIATQGRLPLERFVPLFQRICEVVHAAHELGIVHRDLKPANVMVLARSGALLPKLLDFGIAKQLVAEVDKPTDASSPDPAAATENAGPVDELGTTRPGAAAESGGETPLGLTQDGALIGSPPYMAPEQWLNRGVGPRTDLYALGVLGFEVLTGQQPFRGANLMEVARAHARQAVPELPPELPRPLYAVFAKAMSKRAADRYDTALDLGEAVRVASGLAAEPLGLPALDPTLKEALLTSAPQPLAEAVAALDAVRSVHQARDALWQIHRIATRWVGLVALACRAQIGPGRVQDSESVKERLRTLRRRGLGDADWVALARELLQPFVALRDAHPVPELVDLFHGGADADPFAPILRLEGEADDRANSEVAVRDLLARATPLVEALLRRLAFFASYPLVVAKDEKAERWMGVRRPTRALAEATGAALRPDEPMLLDASSVPVVSLAPLAQVAAPTPGGERELFLLEGPGRHGARLLALPAGFERQDDGVWDWFGKKLVEGGDETQKAAPETSPYRGLAPFQPEDASCFVGREREVDELANRLKRQAFVAVVGPSGAGKSSFVQAGLLPQLPAGWEALTFRPGPSPLLALTARLVRAGLADPDFRGELAEHPAALAVALRAGAAGRTFVLVVDQFEELFSLCGDPEERRAFGEALARAGRSPDDPVRVVVTLRDDFLMRAQELEPLRERFALGLQLLGTPAPEDLTRILSEPLRRAGYEFEDPQLPEQMVAELAGRSGALPLLSFTAQKLWDLRDRNFKQLRRRAYEAMGGTGGALAQHAEETMASLSPEQQRLVREAFRHLVTADGTRAVLSRAELLQILGASPASDVVLETLIARRLLTASESETGTDRVEVIHEALLTAWPRLLAWRQEDAVGARMRDQLRAAARHWDERKRPSGLLWRGDALAEYQLWRTRQPQRLTGLEEAFGAASVRDSRRGRRVRQLALGGTILLLTVGILALTRMNQRAVKSAAEAHERLALLNEEQGRQLLLHGDPIKALVYLNEAYQMGRATPALRFLLHRATSAIDPLVRVFRGHTQGLWYGVINPDGTRALTGSPDGTARIWDLASGATVAVLPGHPGGVEDLEYSTDGKQVLTSGRDGVAQVWDAATGKLLRRLEGHQGHIYSGRLTKDGRRALTADEGGTARVWDLATGRVLVTAVHGHECGIGARFSPDEKQIATAGCDKLVKLWDAATGKLRATLTGHRDRVLNIAFNPNGDLIASVGLDNTARVWDLHTGRPVTVLDNLGHYLTFARFTKDGKRLLTVGSAGPLRIWDPRAGKQLAQIDGAYEGAQLIDDDARVLTRGPDGLVRLFDTSSGSLLAIFGSPSPAFLSVDSTGQRFITGGYDGILRLWRIDAVEPLRVLRGGPAFNAVLDSGTRRVLGISAADRKAWIWDPDSGAELAAVPIGPATIDVEGRPLAAWDRSGARVLWAVGHDGFLRTVANGKTVTLTGHATPITAVAVAPDGRIAVTTSRDGEVRLWDPESGTLRRRFSATGAVSRASFDPSSSLLITLSGQLAEVWSVTDGSRHYGLAGQSASLISASLWPGELAITGSDDATARLWRNGKVVSSFPTNMVLSANVLSPDLALLALGSDGGAVSIWDPANGHLLWSIDGHSNSVYELSFSSDGHRILSGSVDGTAKLWSTELETRTPAELARLVECFAPWRAQGEALVDHAMPASCPDSPAIHQLRMP